jgi:hypothetical protein
VNSDVVIYDSSMAGAPQAAALNSAGAMLALLDACLVNGFNSISVTSLTRSGTVATLVTSGSNNFAVKQRIEVSGVDQAGWNDRWEVATKPASNTVTFTVPTSLAASTTGTISAKHPGAGWTKSAAGTNNAAYKVGGTTDFWLQVEDNNPNADSNATFRARAAKTWTALDTASALGEACLHTKTGGTNAWVIVADPTGFWLYINSLLMGFGRFNSFLSTDAYQCMMTRGRSTLLIGGTPTTHTGTYAPCCVDTVTPSSSLQPYSILRAYTQTGGAVNGVNMGFSPQSPNTNVYPQSSPMPSELDGTVPLLPAFLFENSGANYRLRGTLRGVYLMLGQPTGFATPYTLLDDVAVGSVVKRIAVVQLGTQSGTRVVGLDVSPNWA